MALLGRSEVLAAGDSTQNQSNQSVLQHLYFIIAVLTVLLLVAARIFILRKRNRPVTEFFSIRRSNFQDNSQAPGDHTFSSSYQPSRRTYLAPLPSVYRTDRRVHAADIDSAGRRIGGPDDPNWDGKDILPAYNKFDRPPKYDFGGVPPAQGYTPPAGNYPRDDTVVASTEAIPVVEDPSQSLTSVRTGRSDRVDSPLSAPRYEQ